MIKRDENGIIVQHSALDPRYADGGDSAMRTGLMALVDSPMDMHRVLNFEILPGLAVRHPSQSPWNNPNNFTRDQLIPLMAGAKNSGYINMNKRLFKACIKRGFRAQNTEYDVPGSVKKFPSGADILAPSDMWFLSICASSSKSMVLLFSLCGLPWFILTLLWSTRIKPDDEQNQIICQCIILGPLTTRIYIKLHPNYKKSVMNYWSGWRDQPEIGQALIIKAETICGQT